MVIYLFTFIKLIIVSFAIKIGTFNEDAFKFPDYDNRRNLKELKPDDIRERFLKRKNEMKLLDQYSNNIDSNNETVYLDGIVHYEVGKDHQDWNRVIEITMDLRKTLAAEGMDYVYKRDHFWRTWRKVAYPDGVKVICYKCNSFVNATCKECRSGGYWNIEEDPPCPFELFSVVNNYQICVANTSQPFDYKDPCPSLIKFTDVTRTCDNPIVTVYRVTRMFDYSNRQSNSNTICGKQDYCEISTFYRIYREFILFRVMNFNNDIIYSEIMKEGNNNYYCFENCGRFDPKTNKVTNDKPLSISLFSSRINKRENEFGVLNNTAMKGAKADKTIRTKGINERIFTTGKNLSTIKYFGEPAKNKKILVKDFPTSATVSPCTKFSRQITTEDYEENYVYQDYEHKFMQK